MVLTGVIGLDRGHWSGRGSLVWTGVIGLDRGHWSGRGGYSSIWEEGVFLVVVGLATTLEDKMALSS